MYAGRRGTYEHGGGTPVTASCGARSRAHARDRAAGPLGDFELSAVDAVPIAAVAVLDEEDSAGVWAAPATADPGSLSGVKTEMANGVPGVQL